MIKLSKLLSLLSLGMVLNSSLVLSKGEIVVEAMPAAEPAFIERPSVAPVAEDEIVQPVLPCEGDSEQVSFESFQKWVSHAQKTAYSGSIVSGIRPCLIGVGNGGAAIVNEFVKGTKVNPFCSTLLTLVTDLDTSRLVGGYTASVAGLSKNQQDRALMLKLGSRRSTTGAGGNPDEALRAVWGAEKYFAEVFDPDTVRMKPTVCMIVAAVGGGTGSGGVRALIDMARRYSVPSIVFLVLPFDKGPRESAIAMESFEYAIKHADTVIPVSMDSFIKTDPTLASMGDVRQTELFDREVVSRITSLVETVSANAPGYHVPISPDMADFRAKMGLEINSMARIHEGKISVVASATVKGQGGVQEALERIYRKLMIEYPDFKHVIRNGEQMLVSIQHDGTQNDQGVDGNVKRILQKIGFCGRFGVKVGQKIKVTSSADIGSVDKVPSVKVTLFIGCLDFGDKINPASFGLAERGFWSRINPF